MGEDALPQASEAKEAADTKEITMTTKTKVKGHERRLENRSNKRVGNTKGVSFQIAKRKMIVPTLIHNQQYIRIGLPFMPSYRQELPENIRYSYVTSYQIGVCIGVKKDGKKIEFPVNHIHDLVNGSLMVFWKGIYHGKHYEMILFDNGKYFWGSPKIDNNNLKFGSNMRYYRPSEDYEYTFKMSEKKTP
jgi:hypothetical protein